MERLIATTHKEPWNKGKLTGQKTPLKLKDVLAIRVRLQLNGNKRDLALFNLAIDSKLRACDLVKLKVRDISTEDHVSSGMIILQQKIHRLVQFQITELTRIAVKHWIHSNGLHLEIEQLWKTLKDDHGYLHADESVADARAQILNFLNWYNTKRPHSSLARMRPDGLYFKYPAASIKGSVSRESTDNWGKLFKGMGQCCFG